MKRKVALLLTGIMLLSLTGCGNSENSESTQNPAQTTDSSTGSSASDDEYYYVNGKAPEEVTGNILFWSWDPNFFDMVEKMNDIYPNVTFDFVTVASADDYMQKLQAALTSGSEVPDILAMEINYVGRFYDMGITEDLEEHGIDKSLLIDYLAEIGTDDEGTFIGIPNTAAPGALFYRRDLAKKYLGTDDPDELAAMLSDWDSFIEVGQQIKEESDGTVNMLPGIDTLVQPLVNQSGLRWREDNKLLVEENFTDTIELMMKIKDADIDAGLDIWTPAWNASFAQGNVFCCPGSCWFQSYVIEPNDPEGAGNWGVTTVPGGSYNWGGIWWGMYNQSENKDAVAAWMKYELTKEGAQNKYDLIHFYPGVKAAYEDDYLNKPNEFFADENVTELYLKEIDQMTVLLPLADDALFYNSMTFFAQSLEGSASEIADKIEEDIISSNPQYTK
ncbi:MAG TPA: extracellular solute-binding protein [Candidatus Mediterraneibacter excrementigallinarum]|nr:extracellular solute-binding protein [Candidatus Mediterraneibacter excrementigallinarum]